MAGTADIGISDIGNEVVLQWGDRGRRIKDVRATVTRFPYFTQGSTANRGRQRNTVARSTPSMRAASVSDKRTSCGASASVREITLALRRASAQAASSAAGNPTQLPSASQRRGRPSNHRYGATFRRTVLTLVPEQYADFGPTLATEELAERHGLHRGVETLRQWMIADGLWIDQRHRLPSPHPSWRRRGCLGELVQIDGSEHA
jgi:hypothetical protein